MPDQDAENVGTCSSRQERGQRCGILATQHAQAAHAPMPGGGGAPRFQVHMWHKTAPQGSSGLVCTGMARVCAWQGCTGVARVCAWRLLSPPTRTLCAAEGLLQHTQTARAAVRPPGAAVLTRCEIFDSHAERLLEGKGGNVQGHVSKAQLVGCHIQQVLHSAVDHTQRGWLLARAALRWLAPGPGSGWGPQSSQACRSVMPHPTNHAHAPSRGAHCDSRLQAAKTAALLHATVPGRSLHAPHQPAVPAQASPALAPPTCQMCMVNTCSGPSTRSFRLAGLSHHFRRWALGRGAPARAQQVRPGTPLT